MVEANEYYFDILKILFGDYSPYVYLEIILRVIIIMTYTLLIINWIGKRAVGELGSEDILLIIAMGSAVGDAMFYPSIPLSIPILVITLIAIYQKLFVYISIKKESFRQKMHPKVVKFIENGKLLEDNLTNDKIDKNEVYMLLRQSGVKYLSEVEHAYFEKTGKLSVYKFDNPELKDSILPEDMKEIELNKNQ
ncbi:MAG: YetF domain-containing protein [Psychroserpens sp.]|uniref:DUF421 domain-containing protein n=1 Tax=Psychroserpens sp. TaxID=2020870 RepID=UPI003C978C72